MRGDERLPCKSLPQQDPIHLAEGNEEHGPKTEEAQNREIGKPLPKHSILLIRIHAGGARLAYYVGGPPNGV
jgi:hypothetical protein